MRKVLVVTPNWPPVSCPDLHRVRMALPFFAEFGWEPLILKINPAEQEGIKDPLLCSTVPAETRIWQAECLPLVITKSVGVRNVGLRSFFHLAKMGDHIIRQESPAVAFFSTTMFPVMTLGRYWYRRHQVPYVLDFQDPWLSDYRVRGSRRVRSVKRRLANVGARFLEPLSLRRAAHVVTVSPAYVRMLSERYTWLTENKFTVLPFGAAESDYVYLRNSKIRQTVFDPRDGKRHWVYVGACGPYMAFALRAFFKALLRAVHVRPSLRHELRVHFVGTDYAPRNRAAKNVEPLAQEAGLTDMVIEKTDRVPYFEALQCLLDAEALVLLGSDDPGYTASKTYQYVLAGKPLLAICHADSPIVEILKRARSGTIVNFHSAEEVETVADRIERTGWLYSPVVSIAERSDFESDTARQMTRRLCEIFDRCVKS